MAHRGHNVTAPLAAVEWREACKRLTVLTSCLAFVRGHWWSRLTWPGLRLAPEVAALIRSELIVQLRLVVVVDSLTHSLTLYATMPDTQGQVRCLGRGYYSQRGFQFLAPE